MKIKKIIVTNQLVEKIIYRLINNKNKPKFALTIVSGLHLEGGWELRDMLWGVDMLLKLS